MNECTKSLEPGLTRFTPRPVDKTPTAHTRQASPDRADRGM
nr:hypothetical protein [Kibdelosporangium sp. MJ126-NF4]